jgi:hypothetical protein
MARWMPRQTLLNGTVVKRVKVSGLFDPLVGNLKSTAAAEGLLKTIGDAKQKGSLFWCMGCVE